MAVPYNYKAIEQKWRKNWEEHPVNVDDGKKPKYYCLDMFPYPSGNGLHVGHWRGYVISDVWSRFKMMQGYYLIHPMGWDAFVVFRQKTMLLKWVFTRQNPQQTTLPILKDRLMTLQLFMTGTER